MDFMTSPFTRTVKYLGIVVGGRDHLVADGGVLHVVLAEHSLAQVDAVVTDRHINSRTWIPEMLWRKATHFTLFSQ